jgi:hypothetical protein
MAAELGLKLNGQQRAQIAVMEDWLADRYLETGLRTVLAEPHLSHLV